VPYLGPDAAAARRSDEVVIPVPEPARPRALLAAPLGVHRVVKKRREIALYSDFVEFGAVWDGAAAREAAQVGKVAFLRARLGIRDADLVALSYEGLLGAV
jgi:hypothetical protein